MKYIRLKSNESTGTPILRYYKMAAGEEAFTNAFYEIKNNVASKVSGTPTGKLIGFSHGGDRLAKGLIFLDINTFVVYMGILEDGDTKPNIGDVVNGYQKVIDTHYEEESANGKNDDGFGIEYLDVPYYLFTIVQPTDGASKTIDDGDSGETTEPTTPTKIAYVIKNVSDSAMTLEYTPIGGSKQTKTLAAGGAHSFTLEAGESLGKYYSAISVTDASSNTTNVDVTKKIYKDTELQLTQFTI